MTQNENENETINFFRKCMSAYTTPFLVDKSPEEFQHEIEGLIGTIDSEIEGYDDPTVQRDLSIRFHWGHNHDFSVAFPCRVKCEKDILRFHQFFMTPQKHSP